MKKLVTITNETLYIHEFLLRLRTKISKLKFLVTITNEKFYQGIRNLRLRTKPKKIKNFRKFSYERLRMVTKLRTKANSGTFYKT